MANLFPSSRPAPPSGSYKIAMGADDEIVIRIGGYFDFEVARSVLRAAKARWPEGNKKVEVEMVGVTRIDSCGVGALSLLCDVAGAGRSSIRLVDCSEEVNRLFDLGILDNFFSEETIRRRPA